MAGSRPSPADAHNWLRGSALHFGDYPGSRTYMVEALRICQALGKRRGELFCLAALAGVNYLLYDFRAAEANFAAALNLARTLDYRRVETVALEGLADVFRLRSDYAMARTLLDQSVSLAAELVFPYDEALVLAALIRLHCQLGDHAAAAQRQEQLAHLLARTKFTKECQLYQWLAAATRAHYAGDKQEALRCAEQADQINRNGGDILFRLVDTALILGHAYAAVGQWATAAFHGEESTLFDGMRLVLDQQFAGLSLLERDLLVWLAIERETISVQTLRENLVQPVTTGQLLEALQSLQNRSLLEIRDTGLTLQNVIIEYTTEYLVAQVYQEITDTGVTRWQDDRVTEEHPTTASFLNRFALLKAQAKEYIRQSQMRMIMRPLAERLMRGSEKRALAMHIQRILDALRTQPRQPGYAAGNLLNLLCQIEVLLNGYDFSRLCVWQADLRGLAFAAINLAHADLSHSAFMLTFDLEAVTFSASGQVLVAGILEDDICVWQAADGRLHDSLRGTDHHAYYPVVISEDGRLLASGGLDNAVRIWSAGSGDRMHPLRGHEDGIYELAFSKHGHYLASSSMDGTVCVWDVPSGHRRHSFYEHTDTINALAFTPDGMLLAGGGGDQIIRLWDTRSAKLIRTLSGHAREIECLTFSADGDLLVSGAHDGTIYLWDTASGQHLRTLQGHSQIVRTVLLHPNGHLLTSGGADRLVRLWDLHSGQLLHTLFGHTSEVKTLSFSPDGHVLASGGKDSAVYQWDTRTGRALDSLKGHADVVRSVRFSPHGHQLASGCADGIVRLWDIHAHAATDAACGQGVHYLHGHVGGVILSRLWSSPFILMAKFLPVLPPIRR